MYIFRGVHFDETDSMTGTLYKFAKFHLASDIGELAHKLLQPKEPFIITVLRIILACWNVCQRQSGLAVSLLCWDLVYYKVTFGEQIQQQDLALFFFSYLLGANLIGKTLAPYESKFQ